MTLSDFGHWRLPTRTRGYRVLALALGVTLTMAMGAQTAAVAAPSWEPVVQGSARDAWGPLEDEAVALLHADGYASESMRQFLPGEIRAYVFARLLEIANMPAVERDANAVDKAAFDKLEQLLTQERHWTAVNALAKFNSYKTEQLNCPAASTPTFPGVGVACAFSKMFGNTPSGAAFAAAGYAETFHGLTSGPAATAASEMYDDVTFFQGLELPEGATAAELFQASELKDVLKDKMSEAVREFVQEAAEGLSLGELEAEGWVTLGVSAAVVLGYGIWNAFDVGATESSLSTAVSETDPTTHHADVVGAASTPPGISELLFVTLSQMLAPSPDVVVDTGPACTFNPQLACQSYRFAPDPAFVDARYAGRLPGRSSQDPQFLVRKRNADTGTVQASVDPAAITSGGGVSYCPASERSGLLLWGTGNAAGSWVVHNQTSVRMPSLENVAPLSNPTTAEIRDGMFVQRAMVCTNPPSPQDETWLRHTGLKYVDWQGQWWTAWLHGNTFLHTKSAEPISGTVIPGYETRHSGVVGCTENPSPVALLPTLYSVVGPDCLFGQDQATFSNLAAGDRVLVDGQARIVKDVVDCIHIDFVFAYFKDPGGCMSYGTKAVELEPGLTASWEAFNWADTLYRFLELPKGAPMGQPDRHAVKLVTLNTCAGRAGCTSGTDLANCGTIARAASDCFTSPTIQYKTGGVVEDWSATLVRGVNATGVDLTNPENAAVSAPVATFTDPAGPDTTSAYAASVDWGDGTVTQGTVTLSGGTFTVAGTHTYAEEGSFTVTTSIGHSGITAVATSRATVTERPVVVTGTTVSAVEGAELSAATATFTDPAGPEAASGNNYTATIDWGDGTTASPGTITLGNGNFTATGTHTYVEEGSFTVTTTVDHEGMLSTSTSTATVQDAPLTVTAAAKPSSPQVFTGTTATFTDADPNGTSIDYAATIDWGDGRTSAGVVDGGPLFTVSGSHTYTSTGTFRVTSTVKDHGPGTSVTSSVLVFAFAPGGGAFVIGDHNSALGSAATFWSAQWPRANKLTAGAAPAAFKGFASAPTIVSVGQAWTASSGDSCPPPAGPLPAYMGVIVTDSVARNGSTISGHTLHIAVIATQAGYGPSPGHDGTGTIVAIYR